MSGVPRQNIYNNCLLFSAKNVKIPMQLSEPTHQMSSSLGLEKFDRLLTSP